MSAGCVSTGTHLSGCSIVDRSTSGVDLFADVDRSTTDQIVVPGTNGKPDKVYKVVHDCIPDELSSALVQDFTEYERHEIYHRIDVYQAECDHARPKALWIFGPPAVGKTTICNEKAGDMFGFPDNAVTVDGTEFRMVHKGFQMVAQHGLRNNLLHADAWKLLKGSGFMDSLKEEIVELAVRNRQHLKIPETAVNVGRVNRMLDKLVENGYDLHAVCLYAPKSETEARGRPRGVKEGKAFTTKEYDKASKNAVFFGKLWEEKIKAGDPNYKTVMFYDNTVFPSHPVHLSEFQCLTELDTAAADAYARDCKERKAAHVRHDIAASEARARGYGQLQILAFFSSWWRGIRRADSRPLLSPKVSSDELAGAMRQRGRAEGLFAGIFLSLATISVVSVVKAKSVFAR